MIRARRWVMRVVGLLLAAGWLAGAAWAVDVPMLSGRVVDNAELLSPTVRNALAAKLKAHEDATGNQIVVLTVATLDGDSVEPYAVRVFEAWKLGKKGKDNGVLLLAVPKERKLRIEVGYGLEGVLTDAVTSRIIRNVIAPQFKAGNFDQGMDAGVAALIGQLEGKGADALPAAAPTTKSAVAAVPKPSMSLGQRILFGVFIFGIIGLFTVIGLFVPGMGWFLYLFLIPFWAMFPIAIIGFGATMVVLAIYLIGFPIAKILLTRSDWYQQRQLQSARAGRRGSRYDGMNHSSGSWSSGSSADSWGSSSDSFSSGGGESGGGGSSGDY